VQLIYRLLARLRYQAGNRERVVGVEDGQEQCQWSRRRKNTVTTETKCTQVSREASTR